MASNTFYEKMLPYAKQASLALDIPVSVILGQWSLESGRGESVLSAKYNNYGGIKYTKNADGNYQGFSTYSSIQEFTNDYIRVMKLSYYNNVRVAVSVPDTVKALGNSPYDAGHYILNGVPGGKVQNIVNVDKLIVYDKAGNNVSSGDKVVKSVSVEVPQNADNKTVAGAVIAVGLAMLGVVLVSK